jgi:tetratricopeptide (TPR) repeat protein
LLVAAALAFGATAHAQSEEERERAARASFAAGDYRQALDAYVKLYTDHPHPTYLRNIGRCYQNLGEPDKAVSSLREYLRQATGLAPADRARVEGYIREMEDLKRKREDEQARSRAPDRARPPAAAPVSPPPAAAPPPAQPPAAATPPPLATLASAAPEPGSEPRMGAAPIVFGASLVAIGVGSVFGIRAITNAHTAGDNCPTAGCNDQGWDANETAKNSARIADVAIGAGLAGVAVAAYLHFSGRADGDGRPLHALAVQPTIGRSGAGVLLGRVF